MQRVLINWRAADALAAVIARDILAHTDAEVPPLRGATRKWAWRL